MTAVARKSITDLTRRPARAAFSVLTLAIAVASVGIFAVPSLLSQTMDREVQRSRLADLTVTTQALPLDAAQLRVLARTPNVAALEPKAVFSTRVYDGARRQKAIVIGIPGYGRQPVDAVALTGAAPGSGELLTERQNADSGKFPGGRGSQVRVIAADGRARPLRISGTGRYLGGGSLVNSEGFAVFYATPATVAELSGTPGYTMLAMRLRDTSRAAAERTAAAVRDRLRAVAPGFTGYADYPEIRAAGTYPGEELFEQVTSLMTIITLLALLSAVVLLSNTMSTLIGEQTGEIAVMKAIGATRRQIARIYRRTALMLGGLGALVGALLGVVLANAVAGYFGSRFYGLSPDFHVDAGILAASLLVGVAGPALAALPATRRASRLPLQQALSATGSAVGGQGRLDRLLRRVGFLPRSAQIGLRGAARRKRRSAATAAQVALAVGTLLALLALGASVGDLTRGYYDGSRWDVWAQTYASRPFDAGAGRLIRSVPGVREAQPLLANSGRVAGRSVLFYGQASDSMMNRPALVAGRWFTPAEAAAAAPVAVVGQATADHARAGVGDTIAVRTAAGPARVRIVGIADNVEFQGQVGYLPIATLQRMVRAPGEVNAYLVTSASPDHAAIDRLTTRLEDLLGARGNQVTTMVRYVQRRDNVAQNASLTTTITVLGLLIVAISMVGLVNSVTMGVIERTREIGMLRCVGARAGDVRRIFGVEGLTVALAGWLAGIPVGYGLARALIALTENVADTALAFTFPAGNVAITLAGALALALLVLLAPLRRAVRLKPGDALRYA